MHQNPPFKHRRKVKNYLLNPRFQFKYAFYFLSFGLISALTIQWVIFDHIRDIIITFYSQAGADKKLLRWLDPSITAIGGKFLVFVFIYSIFCFFFGIFITHRIVGPIVAIRRQIRALQEGRYGSQVTLRAHDDLKEIAGDLNQLSLNLKERHQDEDSDINDQAA